MHTPKPENVVIDSFAKGKDPSESVLQNCVGVWEIHGLGIISPRGWIITRRKTLFATFPVRKEPGGGIYTVSTEGGEGIANMVFR